MGLVLIYYKIDNALKIISQQFFEILTTNNLLYDIVWFFCIKVWDIIESNFGKMPRSSDIVQEFMLEQIKKDNILNYFKIDGTFFQIN